MLHFSMAERAGPFRTRCGLEIEVKSPHSGGIESQEHTRRTRKVATYGKTQVLPGLKLRDKSGKAKALSPAGAIREGFLEELASDYTGKEDGWRKFPLWHSG